METSGKKKLRNIRRLWVIEALQDGQWVILPNTVQIRRKHCDWDIKWMREEEPKVKYRVARYEPVLPR